ncbi:MAG: PhzF family phenazine biosynthesis protein [Bacteroidota bacterium]
MTPISVYQVNAFTDSPYAGNPAGVVLDGDKLSNAQMLAIAKVMDFSETAFVLLPTEQGADLKIRWFTPEEEVPLCGHATIASFFTLAQFHRYNMLKPGTYKFRLQTKSGILPVTVKIAKKTIVYFGLPIPNFIPMKCQKKDLAAILGIPTEAFLFKTAVPFDTHLYLEISRLPLLLLMKPNFDKMKEYFTARKIYGMCVYTRETVEPNSAFHSRFFAPTVGINEDPVTGSANGPLGALCVLNKKIKPTNGRRFMIGEQGDAIGRSGRVLVDIHAKRGTITRVTIGGKAVVVSEQMIPV